MEAKNRVVVVVKDGFIQEVYAERPILLEIIDLDTQTERDERKANRRYELVTQSVYDSRIERVF